MNLREGTRRLALLLGIIGAVLGGFASYLELQSLLDQRTRHNRFERLAASDVVQRECKISHEGQYFVLPPNPDKVNKGDIKAIYWADYPGTDSINLTVGSIETEDGQTLYPTPAPAAWLYLLVVLFPILGFFIPWGAIHAIGWVGAGFFQPSK